MAETNRRRAIQSAHNTAHNITPKTVYSDIRNTLYVSSAPLARKLTKSAARAEIERLTSLMHLAAKSLDFESAIKFREEITRLKKAP
jgi:excinuclease ABC subunit B